MIKNKNILYAISLVVIYMVVMQNLAYEKNFIMLSFVFVWLIISYLIYYIRVKRYY